MVGAWRVGSIEKYGQSVVNPSGRIETPFTVVFEKGTESRTHFIGYVNRLMPELNDAEREKALRARLQGKIDEGWEPTSSSL